MDRDTLMVFILGLGAVCFFVLFITIGDLYVQKVVLPKVKRKFIIPDLEAKGFSFLRTARIENKFLHVFNKDKGDFEDGSLSNILQSFNRDRARAYLFLYYLDNGKAECRCTIKITFSLLLWSMKVEYCPEL